MLVPLLAISTMNKYNRVMPCCSEGFFRRGGIIMKMDIVAILPGVVRPSADAYCLNPIVRRQHVI